MQKVIQLNWSRQLKETRTARPGSSATATPHPVEGELLGTFLGAYISISISSCISICLYSSCVSAVRMLALNVTLKSYGHVKQGRISSLNPLFDLLDFLEPYLC
jgi:hypothetical protein